MLVGYLTPRNSKNVFFTQVGVSILENIIHSMDKSRTLLLVISEAFLLSQWCQFEMHLAQHR